MRKCTETSKLNPWQQEFLKKQEENLSQQTYESLKEMLDILQSTTSFKRDNYYLIKSIKKVMKTARRGLRINVDEHGQPVACAEHTPGSVTVSVTRAEYKRIMDSPGILEKEAPYCNVVRSLREKVLGSVDQILEQGELDL